MTGLKFKTSLLFIILLIGFLVFENCSKKAIQRKYYLLDYPGVVKDSTRMMQKPFPFKVMVQTMRIPRTYDRTNVVVRYSAHQIDYYRFSLWAIKPQLIISDLIAQQLQTYQIFEKCEREFLDENPDYEIVGYIDAIEMFHSEQYNAAHLAMKLYLRRSEDFQLLVKHEFDRQEELFNLDMSYFAKKVSDMLREEIDKFIPKMVIYFEKNLNEESVLKQ